NAIATSPHDQLHMFSFGRPADRLATLRRRAIKAADEAKSAKTAAQSAHTQTVATRIPAAASR
ncbi:hypothetical protein, partial [Mycobacterium kansasii]